jgi:hypothetical protein
MRLSLPHEPAAWGAIVRAAVVLGTAFGLSLTEGQSIAIYGFVEVFTLYFVRQSVTPNAKLSDATIARAEMSPPGPPA